MYDLPQPDALQTQEALALLLQHGYSQAAADLRRGAAARPAPTSFWVLPDTSADETYILEPLTAPWWRCGSAEGAFTFKCSTGGAQALAGVLTAGEDGIEADHLTTRDARRVVDQLQRLVPRLAKHLELTCTCGRLRLKKPLPGHVRVNLGVDTVWITRTPLDN